MTDAEKSALLFADQIGRETYAFPAQYSLSEVNDELVTLGFMTRIEAMGTKIYAITPAGREMAKRLK